MNYGCAFHDTEYFFAAPHHPSGLLDRFLQSMDVIIRLHPCREVLRQFKSVICDIPPSLSKDTLHLNLCSRSQESKVRHPLFDYKVVLLKNQTYWRRSCFQVRRLMSQKGKGWVSHGYTARQLQKPHWCELRPPYQCRVCKLGLYGILLVGVIASQSFPPPTHTDQVPSILKHYLATLIFNRYTWI